MTRTVHADAFPGPTVEQKITQAIAAAVKLCEAEPIVFPDIRVVIGKELLLVKTVRRAGRDPFEGNL